MKVKTEPKDVLETAAHGAYALGVITSAELASLSDGVVSHMNKSLAFAAIAAAKRRLEAGDRSAQRLVDAAQALFDAILALLDQQDAWTSICETTKDHEAIKGQQSIQYPRARVEHGLRMSIEGLPPEHEARAAASGLLDRLRAGAVGTEIEKELGLLLRRVRSYEHGARGRPSAEPMRTARIGLEIAVEHAREMRRMA